jgi:hypothetical protein
MKRWEYQVVQGQNYSAGVQQTCDELGAQGWELASTSPILVQFSQGGEWAAEGDTEWFMIFKRPVGWTADDD